MMRTYRIRAALLAAAAAAALPLAACNQRAAEDQSAVALPALPATLPLAPGGPTEAAFAPPVEALPPAPRLDVVRVADPIDYYAYADDALGFDEALYEAPPDYGFYDDDDVEPWGWEGYDQSAMYVEPVEDGYRYYYYRPGEDAPYFIRDPECGYGYDHGRLAIVYGPDGSVMPYGAYGPRLDYASRYYARGRRLYRASRQRHPVIVGNWMQHQPVIYTAMQRWAEQRTRQPRWQAYHRTFAPQQQRYWRPEEVRRRADLVRFAAWRNDDFRSPPPPRAIPAAWQKASWAQDRNRFAPATASFARSIEQRDRGAAAPQQRPAIAMAAPQAAGAPDRKQMADNLREARLAERQDRIAQRGAGAAALVDRPAAAGQPIVARQQQAERLQREQARTAMLGARAADRRAQADAALQARDAAQQQRVRQQADRAADVRTQAASRAAAHQAEVQQRQQAQASRQAEVEARAQQREQAQAARQAQVQARAQADQARQAQARAREEAQASRQAEAQARAQQREQVQAARQAQVQVRAQADQARQAQARAREEAQASRQAEVQARAQQREQAQAPRQAQVQARAEATQARQAQTQARAEAQAARQAQVQARASERQQAREARPQPPAPAADAGQRPKKDREPR